MVQDDRKLHRRAHADRRDPRRPRQVALGLLDDHVHHCVMGADAEGKAKMSDELMASVARLMRRG
jgi:hypothetical protein